MDNRDYELISKMADQAHDKATRAKTMHDGALTNQVSRAEKGENAAAAYWLKSAAGYLNDYFYWIGHHNAYKGIAAGLALREVVETEIDETPSCP